jgi:hypothetical protein
MSSRRSRIPHGWIVSLVIALATYAVFETVVTVLYLKDAIEPPSSVWLFEDSGRTVRFDPVLGYRLLPVPSRIARITKGKVEYVGTLKGNNQGFPDRDDFAPQRAAGEPGPRFAVFGDSYTAAQFLEVNWPDRVEELTRDMRAPPRLLNFAIDGGGLANWWSVLSGVIEKEGYEIDGVIFAVIPGNLWRGFTVADHENQSQPMFGRVGTWDPSSFPKTLDEARQYLHPETQNAWIVTTEEFDRGIKLEWRPRSDKPARPYFASKVYQALRRGLARAPKPPSPPRAFDSFDPYQERMIEEMECVLHSMGIPVWVVHVPSREELLQAKNDAPPPVDTRLFAHLVGGGKVIDGKKAFEGLSADEIRALWFPYDAHWAQGGSDRFAEFMAEEIKRSLWRPEDGTPPPSLR